MAHCRKFFCNKFHQSLSNLPGHKGMKNFRLNWLWILTGTVWLLPQFSSMGAIIKAASCQFSDVNSAVSQASTGDTVQLPAGTAIWSQTLTLNGVSLIGAGSNATILVDEENRAVSG